MNKPRKELLKEIEEELEKLQKENQFLQEENDSLKRENDAYYDTIYTLKSNEACVKNEREPISPLEQSNIDYEKEVEKLKEIIQILLA